MDEKTIVGLTEQVQLLDLKKTILARIDSGATIGSIDEVLAQEIDNDPIGHKMVKSSHGTTKREILELEIELAGRRVKGKFSIFDRSHMTYALLIGQDVLKQGFLIDPQK